jgi:hypothetical protein
MLGLLKELCSSRGSFMSSTLMMFFSTSLVQLAYIAQTHGFATTSSMLHAIILHHSEDDV